MIIYTLYSEHHHKQLPRFIARLMLKSWPTLGGASATADISPGAAKHLSLHAPIMQPPPPPPRPTLSSTSSVDSQQPQQSRGQIRVKLIQARSLNVRSVHARPYVVVQFESNEFVSRDPIPESDKEAKGTPTSRTATPFTPDSQSRRSSSSAINALNGIRDAEAAARARKDSGSSPSSSLISSAAKALAGHHRQNSNGSITNGVGGLSLAFGGGLFSRLSAHSPVWKHEVSFDVTSEVSLVTLTVYDRSSENQGFLGRVQIKPVLVHDHTVDEWYKLCPVEDEAVGGEMRVQITYEQYKTKHPLTPRDFEFLKLIGRGTFGKVFQVRKKNTHRIYAMKVLSKREIIAKKEVAHTIGERKILQRSLDSSFLVGLKFSFQTETDLYLVTDFKSGGELFWHLQRETRFHEERAKFYVAELILALEHLHKYNIVYRDLKPENILLDATGHVALCDFGLSKADLRADELTTTFCGTTEYLAPEILLDEQGYSKIVDFWSLGVLLFEMCCGWSPFYAEDTQQMYKNICFGKIRFPKGVINEDGKMFVKGLLNRNPKHRLGAQRDAAELKEHAYFKHTDWAALARKEVTPPFKPIVESDESTNNFDPEFTEADVRGAAVGLDGFEELFGKRGKEEELDEDDPSEKWVERSMVGGLQAGMHMPNGPLGSDRVGMGVAPLTPLSPTISTGTGTGSSKGIDIKGASKKRKEAQGDDDNPLSSSIQEKFRGFTYHGGESVGVGTIHGAMALRRERLEKERERNEKEREEEEEEDGELTPGCHPKGQSTEDEYEDFEKSAGRYSKRSSSSKTGKKTKTVGFGDLDDLDGMDGVS